MIKWNCNKMQKKFNNQVDYLVIRTKTLTFAAIWRVMRSALHPSKL